MFFAPLFRDWGNHYSWVLPLFRLNMPNLQCCIDSKWSLTSPAAFQASPRAVLPLTHFYDNYIGSPRKPQFSSLALYVLVWCTQLFSFTAYMLHYRLRSTCFVLFPNSRLQFNTSVLFLPLPLRATSHEDYLIDKELEYQIAAMVFCKIFPPYCPPNYSEKIRRTLFLPDFADVVCVSRYIHLSLESKLRDFEST